MRKRRGRFIVLEGADGCGKSTQAERLASALRARGLDVRHVRDPGGTPLSESLRALLLDPGTGRLAVAAETFLYLAARAQLVEEVVAPALEGGAHVVCERWTLSTEVYQGVAGGFGAAEVRALGRFAEKGASPDLSLVLDVPSGGTLGRHARAHDRIESRGRAFHASVARAYRRLARGRRRCVLVPAGDADAVAARVLREVTRLVR